MTKQFRRLAMFTIVCVAVGAAALTSCTKEDEVINNVPAMETKSEELILKTWKYDPINLWFRIIHQDGKLVRVCEHWWYNWMTTSDLCGMVLGEQRDNDVAVAHMETLGGRITRLVLQSDAMEPEIREIYNDFIGLGAITFSENCPITDPKIVEAVGVNNIPAGEYPIRLENNNFVIIISE